MIKNKAMVSVFKTNAPVPITSTITKQLFTSNLIKYDVYKYLASLH